MDNSRPLSAHLQELRNRLIYCVIFFAAATTITYQFKNTLVTLMQKPADVPLYYTSPTGGFQFVFNLVAAAGLAISLPFILYQLLLFISPAVNGKYRRQVYASTVVSVLLMIFGVWFGYVYALPSTLGFLRTFSNSKITQFLTLDSYVTFITHYLLAFAVAFQMPVIIYSINMLTPLTMSLLWKGERWVIVLSFIAAALISPSTNIFNQILVAFPMIFLYQVSILIVYLANKGRAKPHSVKMTPPKPPVKKSVAPPAPKPVAKPPVVRKKGMDGIIKRH